MPSSRSAAALSMAAWMAALSSALPSPAAPVTWMARGSAGRSTKADKPGWAVALAIAPKNRPADRTKIFMVFTSRKVLLVRMPLADRELRVLRSRVPTAFLPRLGTLKTYVAMQKFCHNTLRAFQECPGADRKGL